MKIEYLVERGDTDWYSTEKDPRTVRRITRCKNCTYFEQKDPESKIGVCLRFKAYMNRRDFCSKGRNEIIDHERYV